MNKKRKIMLMGMTDEELWLSQFDDRDFEFDDRDFEAAEILIDLQRSPEPKKRTPFLVVWGRKKRRSPRRVSGSATSPTTPLPTTSDSGDKRRKLLGEFAAALQKPKPEMKKSGLKLVFKLLPIICPPLTGSESDRPIKKRKLADAEMKNISNPWLMPPARKISSIIIKQNPMVLVAAC